MAQLGVLYIDGAAAVSGRFTISNSDTYTVTSTGITFTGTFLEGQSGVWTYSGSGTFAGFALTSGASTPHTSLEIGDSGTFNDNSWWGSGGVYLYSVEATASNDPYLTTGFDLASIADAIRNKTWGTSDLTFPSQYISSVSNLPTGNIQSSRSVTYNSPGSATILPDSGYVGFESAYIEFSPNVWDGQYTWTPPPAAIIEFTITAPWEKTSIEQQTITFQAEDGMAWSEWLSSEYNTQNLSQLNGYVILPSRYNLGYTQLGSVVSVSSLVEANHAYSYTLY